LRLGEGGATDPSFGQMLFIDADASINVPSTVEYSLD
jgi:hypothetical protein